MEQKNQIEVGMKSRKMMMMLSSEGEEDRLSSLPDAILIGILSLLPINFAAATSVLSRRWRNLWTGVTSFELVNPDDDKLNVVYHILSQLTSPFISKFILVSNTYGYLRYEVVMSCLRLVCSRNVQVIQTQNLGFLILRSHMYEDEPILDVINSSPLLEDLSLEFEFCTRSFQCHP